MCNDNDARTRTTTRPRVTASLIPTFPMVLLLVTLNVNRVLADADPALHRTGVDKLASVEAGQDELERLYHYGITAPSSAPPLPPSSSRQSSSAMSASLSSGSGSMAMVSGTGGATSSAEKPYFDDISSRNVTTLVDDTAVLKCRVKHKGDRTVSWMRKRDLHILTSNIYTYTGDQRFSIIHPIDSDDWDLKIEYAQQKDSGIYECQVNTEPKINLAVYLDVTEERDFVQASGGKHFIGTAGLDFLSTVARAKIIGSQEVHVKKGSTISLSCVVNVHASSISWYHGSSVVDFDSARGGISLETEKTEGGTSSRLMLTRATLRDSGNYTCVPTTAASASVQVHVLNGEHPAAMQTSSGVFCPSCYVLVFILASLNSCNFSKLIYFISVMHETVRFVLVPATVSLLICIRRRFICTRPIIPSSDSSASTGSSYDIRSVSSCHRHHHPTTQLSSELSAECLNRVPMLQRKR
ncbi:uncharacterized protein LOC131685727 [Topomyia yanbarensis]|uniref:uncharacterized protein LOC131685727 n=1 Tax=Topomyia yanbarensis TaxID=2498891 RepID=UPI00273C6D2A|nr:uncharacterized protein LOC131685727 [Topomyia yanbarensis]